MPRLIARGGYERTAPVHPAVAGVGPGAAADEFGRRASANRLRQRWRRLLPEFCKRPGEITCRQVGAGDLPAAAVAVQPVDQAVLFRPVGAALVKHGQAVAGGFGESAVAGLGDDRVHRAEQVSEAEAEGFVGDEVWVFAMPVGGDQPADTVRPRPVIYRHLVGDAAHGDQHRLVAVEAEIVAAAGGGNRADVMKVVECRHRHPRRDAQERPGAAVGGEHFGVDSRSPGFMAEKMREEVGPVQRTDGECRDTPACGAGEWKVADVGQHQIRRERCQKAGLGCDAGRPVGMSGAVGGRSRGKVDAQRVMHHVAEIAGRRDMFEGAMDALAQLGGWQPATHGQPQIRDDFRHGLEHRCRDGKVAEAMAGDVGEEMHAALLA